MSARPPASEYIEGILRSDRGWLARAITLLESRRDDDRRLGEEVLAQVMPYTGNSIRVGLTGVPGVGKSTLIDVLGLHLLSRSRSVAVLAIDPSSARSRGSILGDKTRMPGLAREEGAFIRPSPTSGTLGGVARATRHAILLCEAAGFNTILVETVGVGQSETVVAQMVDAFVLLLLAGAGDELQGIKRGVVELADILCVTKAEAPHRLAAQQAANQYLHALTLMQPPHPDWRVPALTCSALEPSGIAELWQQVEAYIELLHRDHSFQERRNAQSVRWMWQAIEDDLLSDFRRDERVARMLAGQEQAVKQGTMTPEAAARHLVATHRHNHS